MHIRNSLMTTISVNPPAISPPATTRIWRGWCHIFKYFDHTWPFLTKYWNIQLFQTWPRPSTEGTEGIPVHAWDSRGSGNFGSSSTKPCLSEARPSSYLQQLLLWPSRNAKKSGEHSIVFLVMSPGYKCSVPASNDEGVPVSNSTNPLPSVCQPPHAVTCNGKIDNFLSRNRQVTLWKSRND